jgi:hypothetical protein
VVIADAVRNQENQFINSRAGNSTRKSDIGEIADETNTRISDAA